MESGQGDVCLPGSVSMLRGTLCTIVSGVLTPTDATTRATFITARDYFAGGDNVTAYPLSEGGNIEVQFSASVSTAFTAVYQAAGGKVSSSNAGGALALGQTLEVVTKGGSNGCLGRVAITR